MLSNRSAHLITGGRELPTAKRFKCNLANADCCIRIGRIVFLPECVASIGKASGAGEASDAKKGADGPSEITEQQISNAQGKLYKTPRIKPHHDEAALSVSLDRLNRAMVVLRGFVVWVVTSAFQSSWCRHGGPSQHGRGWRLPAGLGRWRWHSRNHNLRLKNARELG